MARRTGTVEGMPFDKRVTRLLSVEVPIVQAPVGRVAKPALVAAVAEAGRVEVVPRSLGVDEVRADVCAARELSDRSFGVNLPLGFVRDRRIVEAVVCGLPNRHSAAGAS
jgi:NAD(P)H-dependent flavin oxidoreductase YrpB (nitropropane dioxygenase family)